MRWTGGLATPNPDLISPLLMALAIEVRNHEALRDDFLADPQILAVDAVKGSELILPVQFKTRATRQYAPVREFCRRVRLALEERNLLPGDPYRVFKLIADKVTGAPWKRETEGLPEADPTTLRVPNGNPFNGK
ncbi:MAG TPA: hypothetical protein VMV57_09790 [Terracidiphilus sp.]|nr:hypothetical protein [Terracidiphilus sp.]